MEAMEGFVCILIALLALWVMAKLAPGTEGRTEDEGMLSVTITPPPLPESEETVRSDVMRESPRKDFDLYEDAVTEAGRFDASHESFSSSRFPYKQAGMVTGLTFEEERLFVLRGQGVTVFPFVPSLTLAIVKGRTEGFKETTPFSMTLSSEVQGDSARFPLEFPGWLEVVHQARRAGVVVEMDEALPERLKQFIADPLYGEDDLPPIIVRHAERRDSAPRPAKCPSCGAGVGRKDSCDYCGARFP